jgi:hypothetical protein
MDQRVAQGMGFEDAIEAQVTRGQARGEIQRHLNGETLEEAWAQFVAEYGERERYRGGDVLGWLGY